MLSSRSARGVLSALTVPSLVTVVSLLSGCASWPEWRTLWPQHEHDNFCGHGYLQDVTPNPCPGDFAGADAWRGPLYENEVRWQDPWRGGRPLPDSPPPATPWTTEGPLDASGVPARADDERALPHWPLDAGARPESQR